MYDLTNLWSVGAHLSQLRGTGGSLQHAYGIEGARTVMDNVIVVLGYTWRGFSDSALSPENYTNAGIYAALRVKFDATLFGTRDPDINKVLEPAGLAGDSATEEVAK